MSDLSDETRDLLARGRGGVPLSPERRAAMRAGMLAKVAAATVVATTTTTTAAAAVGSAGWSAVVLKVVGVAMVVGVIGGGTVVVLGRGEKEEPKAPPAASLAPSPPPSPSPSPSPAPSPAPSPSLAPSLPLPRPLTPTLAKPPSTSTSTATTTTEPAATVAPKTASSLEAEALGLQEAHRALSAGDGARTLQLLDEHAARYPRSALEPERSAERVFALCQQGRIEAARTAADTFLASHPDGPLAGRVRGSCARTGQ